MDQYQSFHHHLHPEPQQLQQQQAEWVVIEPREDEDQGSMDAATGVAPTSAVDSASEAANYSCVPDRSVPTVTEVTQVKGESYQPDDCTIAQPNCRVTLGL